MGKVKSDNDSKKITSYSASEPSIHSRTKEPLFLPCLRAGGKKTTSQCCFLTTGKVFLYEREEITKRSEFRKRVTEAIARYRRGSIIIEPSLGQGGNKNENDESGKGQVR